MSDIRSRLLDLLNTRAVVRKQVTLASGQRSDYYIDCRAVLLHGEAATLIGQLVWKVAATSDVIAIGGPESAALPITAATVIEAYRCGKVLEGFYIRKEAKTHGLQKRIEGRLEPGWRVIVVEDVMTTGGSALSAVQTVQDAGAQVVQVVCLVDRLQGARERFSALGVPLHALFTLHDLSI